MRLKNKRTGEIAELCSKQQFYEDKTYLFLDTKNGRQYYNSLAELNAEWEDTPEEPKEHWYIGNSGLVHKEKTNLYSEAREAIGNCFGSPKEAEKAVEKLKAWKRLKNKGFRFDGWKCTGSISFTFDNYYGDGQPRSASDDLDLLFSGGEE